MLLGNAYATVWLEKRLSSEKELRAVKRIPKRSGTTLSIQPLDEAVIMSVLSHSKNDGLFVNFHGWYETDDSLCLTMEYIEKGDLDKYLNKHGAVQEIEARLITEQLLEGLQVIHDAKFIHRDLKPGNILIQHASPWWVKISDFGISRRLETLDTLTFTALGTPGYKAPEVTLGERSHQTPAVDMWSLGCVVFKLLTNTIPFENQRKLAMFTEKPDRFGQQLDELGHVSGNAKDFMKALIITEPSMRATVQMAISSAWQSESSSGMALLTENLESLVPLQIGVDKTGTTQKISDSQQKDRSAAFRRFERYRTDCDEALHRSVCKNDLMTMDLLLDRGADINKRDNHGETPLHHAVRYSYKSAVELLIHRGAVVDKTDNQNITPLNEASRHGSDDVARLLIDAGADINHYSKYGQRTLHRVARHGHASTTRLLLEYGAEIDVVDGSGWTPMHEAAYYGHEEVVRVLLESGANAMAYTSKGRTVSELARARGHMDIATMLSQNESAVAVWPTFGRSVRYTDRYR